MDVAEEWCESLLKRKRQGFTHYRDCKDKLVHFKQQLGKFYLKEVTKPVILKFCYWLNERTYETTTITVVESLEPLLKERGLKFNKTAKDMGVARATLALTYKVGERISKDTMDKICKFLNIQPNRYFKIVTTQQPYSWSANKSMVVMLKSILGYAVEMEYIDINHALQAKTDFVTGTKGKKKIIDNSDDILRFCTCVSEEKDIRKRVAFSLMINLGMRNCEIMGLEWHDFNFGKAEVFIQRNTLYVSGFGIVTKSTKTTKSERTISIPDGLLELLKEYKVWWDDQKIRHGDLWQDTDRLFCSNNGNDMAGRTVANWLREFEIANNLPHVTPHGMRHTNITMLLKNGMSAVDVAGRVGHADATMISKVYGHFTTEADRKAAKIIDSLVNVKAV